MDTLDYWTPEDALALRCEVAAVGTLRPAGAPVSVAGEREDVTLARAHAPRAIRALVRIMESDAPRAALEAAKELLMRAYGPAYVAPAPAAPAPALPQPEEWPEWLTQQRLADAYGLNSQRLNDSSMHHSDIND